MNTLIVIPTYNEKENISDFIEKVFENTKDVSILVVDDGSPDGTAEIVEELSKNNDKINLMQRGSKQGLATAYIEGFKWGIERGFDVFLEMDADFSHNPKYVPKMLELIQNNDVVIGSRNIKGGSVQGWGFLRNFISKGGSIYAQIVLGINIKDLTGGFNMWRKSALDKIGLYKIISRGYLFQIEMKYRAKKAGCSIVEFPILFEDRTKGKSKMSKKIFIEAFLNLWKIRFSKI